MSILPALQAPPHPTSSGRGPAPSNFFASRAFTITRTALNIIIPLAFFLMGYTEASLLSLGLGVLLNTFIPWNTNPQSFPQTGGGSAGSDRGHLPLQLNLVSPREISSGPSLPRTTHRRRMDSPPLYFEDSEGRKRSPRQPLIPSPYLFNQNPILPMNSNRSSFHPNGGNSTHIAVGATAAHRPLDSATRTTILPSASTFAAQPISTHVGVGARSSSTPIRENATTVENPSFQPRTIPNRAENIAAAIFQKEVSAASLPSHIPVGSRAHHSPPMVSSLAQGRNTCALEEVFEEKPEDTSTRVAVGSRKA